MALRRLIDHILTAVQHGQQGDAGELRLAGWLAGWLDNQTMLK